MTPPALAPHSADALLFDLGRVVLDISFDKVMAVWAGHAGRAPADIAGRFVVDDNFRHHEVGKLDDAAFFASLRRSLGIGLTDDQFLEGWNALFAGEMPGIAPMLERAARSMPLYAFSNTNPAHVAHFSTTYSDVLGHFREIFLSSAIGLRKRMPRPTTMSCARSACRPRASCSSMTAPRISRAPARADWPPFT
jgi:putative hydrolase of the HAD superfamily